MSTTFVRSSRDLLFSAIVALACNACIDEAPAELGIYDQQINGSNEKPGTQTAKPPAKSDAASADSAPTANDAGVPVEVDAEAVAPAVSIEDAGTTEDAGLAFALPEPLPPELRCFPLLAHSASDAAQPYVVPKLTDDLYVNFTFDAPFPYTQYLRVAKPIISETVVIHRFRLFENATATAAGVSISDRKHPGASLLATWAPNGDPVSFPRNTGMRMRGDVSYTLEVHYRNLTGDPVEDRSGFELCVSAREPTFVVGLSRLAGQTLDGDSLTGVCTPSSSEPVHVLGLQPQFDARTKHIEVTLQRSMAAPITVWDENTSFDFQRSREANLELRPGDTLTTTCTRKGANEPGSVMKEPACNLYVFHWPAHALISAGAEDAADGIDTCLR